MQTQLAGHEEHMRGKGGIGALVGGTLVVGCTWIPLDGPLGRNRPANVTEADTDTDVDTDTDADADADADTDTTDTGTEPGSNVIDGEFDLGKSRALWVGEAPEDHSAASLAVNGDLTGDGVTDLVIGSWWWDTNVEGSAYVVSADAVGTVSLGSAAARLTGGGGTELVGCSVAAGDMDGDSRSDVMIGAHDAAFIVPGPVSGIARAEDVAVSRFERAASAYPGVCFRLTAAGDINSDGDADLLIAYENEYPRSVSIFVADATPGSSDLDDLPDRVEGDAESMGAVTSADVDGDGVQDVLIGDYMGASRFGTLTIVQGPIVGAVPLQSADAVLSGPADSSIFGLVSANAGDVNGDGREDVLVGAPGAAQDPPVPGTAFLWTTEMAGEQPATSADAIIEGVEPQSGMGTGLAAGDVDGDGASDLFLGAQLIGWGDASFGFGAAYLLYGPVSGSVDVADAIILRGDVTQPGSLVGAPLALLGDIDGDGLDDMAVMGSGVESNAGGTYLVFGSDLL